MDIISDIGIPLILQPMLNALLWLYSVLGGQFWLAIVIFTVVVRVLMTPLMLPQQRAAKKMQEVQPRLQEIQKKYAKDREKLAQEQMKLYREAGVNPMGGCLPLLIQFPILIGLYNALIRLAGIGELVGERFFYIPDLSFPDASVGTGWLGAAWAARDCLESSQALSSSPRSKKTLDFMAMAEPVHGCSGPSPRSQISRA